MKQRQILIRVFLAILCLPLTACLYTVKTVNGTTQVKYPIVNGVVDLTNVSSTELGSLKLGGYKLLQSGNQNVSLECKTGNSFTPIFIPPTSTSTAISFITPADLWGPISAICDLEPDGENYLIELALNLGDYYAPIVTKSMVECVVLAMITPPQKQLLTVIGGCVAPAPTYGFNSTVEGINVLKLRVPQEVL